MRSQVFSVRNTMTISALTVAAALMVAPSSAHAEPPPASPLTAYDPAQPQGVVQPGYYLPPSVIQSGPGRLTDWQEGEQVPAGYHPVSRVRTGLVIGGAVTFGVMYLSSALAAAIGHDSGMDTPALYAPIVGPFIQMGSTSTATGNFFLAMDGLLQAGGAAMFIAGLAAPKTILVRNDLAKATPSRFQLTPVPLTFGKNGGGLGFVGTF